MTDEGTGKIVKERMCHTWMEIQKIDSARDFSPYLQFVLIQKQAVAVVSLCLRPLHRTPSLAWQLTRSQYH